jgi:hypothetical protein
VREVDRSKADRKRFQVNYRALYDEVPEVLFREDPCRVHPRRDNEKYVPEVVTILPRLPDGSVLEVQQIVQEELRRWYGRRISTDRERLEQAANDIWFAWHRFLDF